MREHRAVVEKATGEDGVQAVVEAGVAVAQVDRGIDIARTELHRRRVAVGHAVAVRVARQVETICRQHADGAEVRGAHVQRVGLAAEKLHRELIDHVNEIDALEDAYRHVGVVVVIAHRIAVHELVRRGEANHVARPVNALRAACGDQRERIAQARSLELRTQAEGVVAAHDDGVFATVGQRAATRGGDGGVAVAPVHHDIARPQAMLGEGDDICRVVGRRRCAAVGVEGVAVLPRVGQVAGQGLDDQIAAEVDGHAGAYRGGDGRVDHAVGEGCADLHHTAAVGSGRRITLALGGIRHDAHVAAHIQNGRVVADGGRDGRRHDDLGIHATRRDKAPGPCRA